MAYPRTRTIGHVPFFICPRCKERSIDHDGVEGFGRQSAQCRSCGFGFLFELLDDYYPAPGTGLVVCDANRRILAVGRDVFELTGYTEAELMGGDLVETLGLSETAPLELVREWGVRQLGQRLMLRSRSGIVKPVIADFFPAYDDDGGLLVALTAAR